MRRLIVLTTILVILLGFAAPSHAQDPIATTPETVLYTYFNALNRAEYATAYRYTNGSQPFLDFVQGFRTTARIAPYFGVQQVSGGTIAIPTVLVGYQDDGSVNAFAGCLGLSATPIAGVISYVITQNTLQAIPLAGAPDLSAISDYVNTVPCFPSSSTIAHPLPSTAAVPSLAETTIQHYVAAINANNTDAAYRFWLYPLPFPDPDGAPATDYRPAYDAFAAGYRNTRWINVYTNGYDQLGGSAGRAYLDGLLPVVLVDQVADWTINTYVGCYVMGYHQDGRLGIVNGQFSLAQGSIPPTAQSLEALLNGTDCQSLGIPN